MEFFVSSICSVTIYEALRILIGVFHFSFLYDNVIAVRRTSLYIITDKTGPLVLGF